MNNNFSFNVKYALINAFYFMMVVGSGSYGYNFLKYSKFDTSMIGIALTCVSIIALIIQTSLAPIIDRSEKWNEKKLILATMAAAILLFACMILIPAGSMLLLVFAVLAFALAMSGIPYLNSLAFAYEQEGKKINYGIGRGVGSAAYAIGAALIGWLVSWLGGADDLCAERYLLPLQSGRMALQPRIIPGEAGYPQAAACLQEAEEANKVKNAGYELAIKGALLRFLSILIGQHGTLLPADTTDTRRLKTVLQLIEAEYATPLRIEDAAEACGCSQSHFMRWFKKMTGQGFTAYLNDHRLNLAAELLRITDATVLDIAGRVGFDNLSYFNRLFKRRYGMTPREYRSK